MFFVASFWILGLVAVEGILYQAMSSFLGSKWALMMLVGLHALAWGVCELVNRLSPMDLPDERAELE
jgi:hypothetical protein